MSVPVALLISGNTCTDIHIFSHSDSNVVASWHDVICFSVIMTKVEYFHMLIGCLGIVLEYYWASAIKIPHSGQFKQTSVSEFCELWSP